MRIAVLGLGRMGAAIADRIAAAGHDLTVWNRSPAAAQPFADRGVRTVARPADAWTHADVCLTMLADDVALKAVTTGPDGLLDGLDAHRGEGGPVVIDMGTVAPPTSAGVAAALAERDVPLLRAPVSGNPSVVAAGNLAIVVSGPRPTFDALEAALRDIGPTVFYVGAEEQARVLKLALNLILAGTAQLLAEALVLLEADGVARADALAVIGGSAVGSPFVRYKTEALVADDYRSTFTAELMSKDLGLALDAGRAAGVPLALTALTQQLYQGAIAQGMGDQDLTAVLPRLRREAGLAD